MLNGRYSVVEIYTPNDWDVLWKQIPDFSKYEAGSNGVVRRKTSKGYFYPKIIEVPSSNGTYLRCSALSDSKKHRSKEIHHLVCSAFHGPPPTAKHEVNHLDGNKHNNLPSNLAWSTRGENITHAYETGLRKDGVRVVVYDCVKDNNIKFATMASAGRHFDLNESELNKIIGRHSKVPWLGRYLFKLDFSNNLSKSDRVWAKDLVSGIGYVFESVLQASVVTGVNRATISDRLNKRNNAMVSGWSFQILGSKTGFFTTTAEEALRNRKSYESRNFSDRNRSYLVKDYLSGEIASFEKMEDLAKYIGYSQPNVSSAVKDGGRLLKQYYVMEDSDNVAWPEISLENVLVSIRAKQAIDTVMEVHDLLEDTTKLYCSIREFADSIGHHPRSLANWLRINDKPYLKRYTFNIKPIINN